MHLLRLDPDFLFCLGIASRSGCLLGHLEGPEHNDGHVNALLQRLGDGPENSVNCTAASFFVRIRSALFMCSSFWG